MKIKIISIHNRGDYDKEYVLLKVSEDCDVGRHILADSTYLSDTKISNKIRHTYWFPDKEVKKGDLISVWTKSGENTTTKSTSNIPLHRFHWDLKVPVWNDDGDCAVLFEINTWSLFEVGK